MASVFPGARNLQEFWDIILNKVDCITDVPPSRWKIEDYYDPDPKTPDKTYCKRGGFIPDLDFDPAEYGLPPNILEATDVSQLLALQTARDALKDAGYAASAPEVRERTGIVLGTVVGQQLMRPLLHRLQYPVWQEVFKSSGLSDEVSAELIEKIKAAYSRWEENSFPGFLSNVIAGRIANRLDLGGLNCVVDAACASSLSAVNMAVSELALGHTDMMITGGVDIDNSILTYMCFSKTPAFSRKDKVQPFDAASDGMMVGEGIGMLVLKRLADAERDGDRVYAVIKGIGSSSDGRSKSIYAPHPPGQVKALERAYQAAGFSPRTIGLVEAHGTGTVAGDICEVTALSEVFGQNGPGENAIALGSVKSQIGHTKAAAGSASLIKTALALYHKVLPPTINITEPNPKLKLDQTPFYLNTESRPWLGTPGGVPRRAGVSSFGFGGTNFHVVLEEYTAGPAQAYRLNETARSILLQAPTPAQLLALCEEYRVRLNSPEAEFYFNELAENAKNLAVPPTAARLGFLAHDRAEAAELLELSLGLLRAKPEEPAWEHPQGIFYRRQALAGKVVALFSGQGAQYLEMGRSLAINFPPLRAAFSALDQLFQAENQTPLSEVVFPPPTFEDTQKAGQKAALQRTDYAQPAIGAVSSGLYRLLFEAGFRPDFVAGHSFGELSALLAAGVLSEPAYFRLVKARGKAMAAPSDDPTFDPGGMVAVSGTPDELAEILAEFPDITLANHNSLNQVVLAGAKPAVARLKTALKERRFSVVDLPVAAAFHTPLVGHAQQPFEKALQAENFQSPQIPVFSNSTAQPYPADPDLIRGMLGQHLRNPVLFKEQIENIYAAGGFFFIEFGPREILTNLVKNILGDKPYLAVALNASPKKDSDDQLRQAVIQLRVAGIGLQDVDPYRKPQAAVQAKKSIVTVQLNGSPYVSEASRQLYRQALAGGKATAPAPIPDKVEGLTRAVIEDTRQETGKQADKEARNEVSTLNIKEATMPSNSFNYQATSPDREIPASPVAEPAALTPVPTPEIAILEANLDRFTGYQSAAVQVHEQFLNNQAEYTRGFFQLMQQQQSLLLNAEINPAPGVVDSLERNMMRFHDYQAETLRVHDHFLSQEAAHSSQLFETITRTPANEIRTFAPPTQSRHPSNAARLAQPAPAPAPAPAPLTPVKQTPAPVAPVKVNTNGHIPAPVVEAPANNHRQPQTPAPVITSTASVVSPEVPVTPQVESWPVAFEAAPPATPAPAPVPAAPATPAVEKGPAISVDELTRHLVQVVSDKTGYPVEMLSLEMDMEADLGIDSIKRVEILGAMQDSFPDLPRLSSDALAEMRTLGQIVESMAANLPDSATAPTPAPVSAYLEPEGEPGSNGASPHPTGLTGQVVRLKSLPGPDYLEAAPPPNHVCLITDDGSQTPARLAQALAGEGWRPVILNWLTQAGRAGEVLPEGTTRLDLGDTGETGLEQALQTITAKYGPVGGFIHLSPATQPEGATGLPFDEAENRRVKQVFLLAKHLKNSLTQAATQGRACFLTVARLDGNLGLGQHGDFGAVGGGLFGLTKSLGQEWPGVHCRALDLSPALDAEQAANAIMSELHDPNRLLVEVGYGPAGRVTLVSEEVVLK
jgi:polyketide-type polyunsaturated fatty acid synthase PfaA